jgi:HSP20 family protein
MRDRPCKLPVCFWAATEHTSETLWRPSADIYRTRTGWLLKFDLAGVRLEDVTVEVTGSQVTVRGRRRDWIVEQGTSHYSMEISYSRFERAIELPGDLEGARIRLEAREGILLVRVITRGEEQ